MINDTFMQLWFFAQNIWSYLFTMPAKKPRFRTSRLSPFPQPSNSSVILLPHFLNLYQYLDTSIVKLTGKQTSNA